MLIYFLFKKIDIMKRLTEKEDILKISNIRLSVVTLIKNIKKYIIFLKRTS
jgi:hypothetical protein